MDISKKDNKELNPIIYSASGVKVKYFSVIPNKSCFRLHWHERIEMILVTKGEMNVIYGTSNAVIKTNEIVYVPPKMPHRAYTTDSAVEYVVLMFDVRSFYNDIELCHTYLPAVFDNRVKFNNIINHPEILSCFNDICIKWEEHSLAVTAKIYWLLYLMFEYNLADFKQKISCDETLMKIINYMEENYKHDISTASLCEQFGYTATHFGRKFREGTGLSPMTYLKIYRLEEAYKLLKKGNKNIGEIATQCGFSDANYFTRCFKSHFGVAPTQLVSRKKSKK